MGQLRLHSQVVYMPGHWGVNAPVAHAAIEIVDVDEPGKDDDRIWSGTTDGDGRFRGTSGEWQDSESFSVPVADWQGWHWEHGTMPDVTDALVLQIHVTDGDQDGWFPYVYWSDEAQSPAIVVPWAPRDAGLPLLPDIPLGPIDPRWMPILLAAVNGEACMTLGDVNARVQRAVAKGATPIHIDVFDPAAMLVMRTSDALDNLATWAGERLGIPERWRPSHNRWVDDDMAGASVACAVVKTGIASSPLLVHVGVSVLYAVNHGYHDVSMGASRKSRRSTGSDVRFTVAR